MPPGWVTPAFIVIEGPPRGAPTDYGAPPPAPKGPISGLSGGDVRQRGPPGRHTGTSAGAVRGPARRAGFLAPAKEWEVVGQLGLETQDHAPDAPPHPGAEGPHSVVSALTEARGTLVSGPSGDHRPRW